MELFDENGFRVLIRKNARELPTPHKSEYQLPLSDITEKEKKKAKAKWKKFKWDNPFKKKSWKFALYKYASMLKPSKNTVDFHFTKLENIVVYRPDKPKAILQKGPLSKKDMEMLLDAYPDCYILINSYDNLYTKISLKTYRALCDVHNITVSMSLNVYADGEDESFGVYNTMHSFSNINELMSWIIYLRKLIDGVGEVQTLCCNYDYFEFDIRTIVVYEDGSTDTFKGDFNEFMEHFHLVPLL